MKNVVSYVVEYFISVDKRILIPGALFTSIAVFINYHFGLNQFINSLDDGQQYLSWYFVFLIAFSLGYFFYSLAQKQNAFRNTRFVILLLVAPAIFAWKMVFAVHLNLSADPLLNEYWNRVIYWPFKLVTVSMLLALTWLISKEDQPLYGLHADGFQAKPYFIMLLIMVPLIAVASTQPDFLTTYPKLKNVSFLKGAPGTGLYQLLYELSYGSDFFTIEFFFRGFLVLAFTRWFGMNAILPMAMFYCTIHFGKPMGECISSFFGGLVLGAVTYNTRSIYGGFMVHVGIAWMMELGGYLGNMGLL